MGVGTSRRPVVRLYFLTGTPHSSGPLTSFATQDEEFLHDRISRNRMGSAGTALNMDDWIRNVAEPPASRYPTVAKKELVTREALRFPKTPSFEAPEYMPQVWRMHYGENFADSRVITKEPPTLGNPYTVLVPQVNADGNELGGIPIPEVAVPPGTHTGGTSPSEPA